jgi:hypothetical protein
MSPKVPYSVQKKPKSVLFREKEASYPKDPGNHRGEGPADSGHTTGEWQRPGFQNDSIGNEVDKSIQILADLGYLGIAEFHGNSLIPKKSSKNHKLNEREKAYNKRLARKRVVIEHINAKIKTFKIMAYPSLNHCRRHLLRMSLICGIINFELRI